MRFQYKLFIIYAIFLLVVSIAIGIGAYSYSVHQINIREQSRLDSISIQINNRILEVFDLMKYRTDTLLAEPNTLESMKILSTPYEYSDEYVREARNALQKSLMTDSVMSKFYRVIVFNQSGQVITTKHFYLPRLRSDIPWDNMTWLDKVDAEKGTPTAMIGHDDVWAEENSETIFSLIRAVQGNNLGYIEVQQSMEALEKLIKLPDKQLELVILINENECLYSNVENFSINDYREIIENESFKNEGINSVSNDTKLVSKMRSDLYDISVLVMKDKAVIKKENRYLFIMIILIDTIFYIVTLGFIMLLSYFISKPIRQLRNIMERTELSNINEDVVIGVPNDEIEALNISYQNLLERFKRTIEEEKQIIMLQMETQFDLLQVQVNPHFLFNVLNVLSSKGLANDDESICDICGNLADMLRYSTNTKEKHSTVEEEIEYVKKYLYILSSRYEHKLNFSVEYDDLVKKQVLPKITIQQFVENSIRHAFKDTAEVMEIEVSGSVKGNGWSISIKDNGCGFSQEALDEFEKSIETIKHTISNSNGNIELNIGGMGLANTFARLYLLYGDSLSLSVSNTSPGTNVEINVESKGI